jgi:hypothetical protein
MGHIIETCDFVDVLEEAAVLGTEVAIDLRDGGHFTDTVRDVVVRQVFILAGRFPTVATFGGR